MAAPKDRFLELLKSISLNGIDFVELNAADPSALRVHFINAVKVATAGMAATIAGGDSIPSVPVDPINNAADWSTDADGRPLLTLHVGGQGDFSDYTLSITGAPLDIFYASTRFSFKALCPSDFDCAPAPPFCPPDDTPLPPIDYLAKDYMSFRQALSDFSALRYPDWQERSEADFGMMVLEALSAVGDELSYLQDRVAAEAALQTATQRRSLVSLARLVDYEPRPATSGTTIIQCNVSGGSLPAGVRISAAAPDGSPVPFEVGTGLADTTNYVVSPRWNDAPPPHGIQPYWFDDSQLCLPRGSTEMWVQGTGFGFIKGLALLIQTELPGESIRQIVHLTDVGFETTDQLFPSGGPPTPVTQIRWGVDEALLRDRDLRTTRLAGNLLPATQGERVIESFAVETAPPSQPGAVLAIARRGPNSGGQEPNVVYRFGLARASLAWLADVDPSQPPAPEIHLAKRLPVGQDWSFSRSLLDAGPLEPVFTVDPIAWRAIAWGDDGRPTQYEIDGDQGCSIRFGDGVFGAPPAAEDLFDLAYRIGLGGQGNVAADSITSVDPAWSGLLNNARNPFPVTVGADAESAEHIRRMAPQAFRTVQFRAVRPEDYEAAAESFPWVEKAGTSFRWTGSWLTVFTAVDPKGTERIALGEHLQLIELLNRRRLAGYESYAPLPRYVAIDLRVIVCVEREWLPGDVERGVLDRLGSAQRPDGSTGFFFADRFTFGTPLYRSRLEAAIQSVPGVKGVLAITYRRRGSLAVFIDLPEALPLGTGEILRVDNDPSWPERGTIRVLPEGGR
jgi:hypothetical protein